MRTYLASSKFFNNLRKRFGIEKPEALEWGGWKKWEANIKAQHPYAYFFTETLPDFLSNVYDTITAPYHDACYYIRNRFIRKCHVLPTGFKPGEYHDLDSRMLHGLMQALVDFVEVEKAHMHRWLSTAKDKQYKFKNGRSAEAGLDYLRWEMSLTNKEWLKEDDPNYDKPTGQALNAKEVYEIYNWWKNVYPNRVEPMEASGWSALCDRLDAEGKSMFDKNETAEDRKEKDRILKKLSKIEKQYDREDEQMLIRLIKIRKSLWT